MEQLVTDITHAPWLSLPSIIGRMLLALFFGALVGLERERKNRSAGLRTHMLVCLASASVAILTLEIAHMQDFGGDSVRIDPIRLVEAVTGGVAFLAAGFIVFTNGKVRGLTTGAGMWLAGAIGLACGLGQLQIAAVATLLAITVLWLLGRLESKLDNGERDEEKAS